MASRKKEERAKQLAAAFATAADTATKRNGESNQPADWSRWSNEASNRVRGPSSSKSTPRATSPQMTRRSKSRMQHQDASPTAPFVIPSENEADPSEQRFVYEAFKADTADVRGKHCGSPAQAETTEVLGLRKQVEILQQRVQRAEAALAEEQQMKEGNVSAENATVQQADAAVQCNASLFELRCLQARWKAVKRQEDAIRASL